MKKFDNFKKAYANLSLCRKYNEPYDVVTETGLVNLFSICFEQSWKAMKEILENHGYDEGKTGSPKMIMKLAYRAGMIKDEQAWLAMLDMRNTLAHSYNEDVAFDVIKHTKDTYLNLFEKLIEEIEEKWI